MSRTRLAIPIALAVVAAACGPRPAPAAVEDQPTVLTDENVATVELSQVEAGPLISGSLEAAKQAVLRAEASGSVTQLAAELGDMVQQGQLLARVEDQGQRGQVASAASAVRAAEEELSLSRRQVDRTRRLVAAGALAAQNGEQAEAAAAASSARLAQARAQWVSARRQLDASVVRAPFDGVVSERAVNAGDVVAPGTPLVTLIDPSSMRLQASVPSDTIGAIDLGQRVRFEVRGYPEQGFEGRIERIAPAADAVTRQVTVLVEIPNPGGKLVAGLYAEGRIVVDRREALVVPLDALLDSSESPSVLRVADGHVQVASVTLGIRDERAQRVEITGGLAENDVVVTGPARNLRPGTRVQVGESLAARSVP